MGRSQARTLELPRMELLGLGILRLWENGKLKKYQRRFD